MQRLRPRGEDGAVAVFVGIMTVLLFGMGALVIDVGAIYAERRQLQNGADAAALAVALGCAKDPLTCTAASGGLAGDYANANANDGETAILQPDIDLDFPASTVTIDASTLNDGSTALPPVFGELLMPDGYDGATIHASATARWGGPLVWDVVPLGIGRGEWGEMTGEGARYGEETTIYFGTTDDGGARGFGWLPVALGCETTLQVGQPRTSSPSSLPVGTGCTAEMLDDFISSGEPMFVPIYSRVGLSSDSIVIDGFAAFVLTGYQLDGRSNQDWRSPGPPPSDCDPDQACIQGYFDFVTTEAGEFGSKSLGLAIVRLVA